jgi:hypothetical protein
VDYKDSAVVAVVVVGEVKDAGGREGDKGLSVGVLGSTGVVVGERGEMVVCVVV